MLCIRRPASCPHPDAIYCAGPLYLGLPGCLQVLEEVAARVEPDLGPLLEVTSGPESSLQSFNFLGNSLLAEVDYAVGEIISGGASHS